MSIDGRDLTFAQKILKGVIIVSREKCDFALNTVPVATS